MLGMHNGFLLGSHPDHSYILGNGWKEGFGEPVCQELIQDLGLDHFMPSSPLMNMTRNVSGSILTE